MFVLHVIESSQSSILTSVPAPETRITYNSGGPIVNTLDRFTCDCITPCQSSEASRLRLGGFDHEDNRCVGSKVPKTLVVNLNCQLEHLENALYTAVCGL